MSADRASSAAGPHAAEPGRQGGEVADPDRPPVGFELSEVEVWQEDRQVLTGIDLRLPEHRIGLIGPNGSGKSTLARLLNGLLQPTAGTVRWRGEDVAGRAKAVRRQVGFVFQNPDNQIVMPLVGEDIAFGVRNLGVPRPEIPGRVRDALARLGLDGFEEREAHTLSGGEKQLLALAGVLVMQPEAIVFDEPTTLLDLPNTRRLLRIVDDLRQQVVMISHDLEVLAGFDRVIALDSGRVVDDGSPAEVIEAYRRRYR